MITAQTILDKARKIAAVTFDSHSNLELGLKVALTVGLLMAFVGYLGSLSH